MRGRLAALATTLVTAAGAMAMFSPPSATAQSSFPGSAVFSAYASGTKQHVRIVDSQGQTLANVDTSFSAATANSQGLGTQINNVFNEPAQPVEAGKNSYSRAAAAEVSLGAKFPANTDPSQIILPSLQEAIAAPSTALMRQDLIPPIQGDPLLYVAAATDKNQALWNPGFCPLGQPISYGENDIADAELLNASSTPMPNGAPVVSETPTSTDYSTNFHQSFSYLFPNGDGTFGVGAVNRQVFAPITIGKGQAPLGKDLINITLLGTWVLRVEDAGKGAPPSVTYAAYDTATGAPLTGATPVANVDVAGTQVLTITAQQVFGPNGFSIAIPPPPTTPTLLQLSIGTPPTAISGMTNGFTTDAIRLTALNVPQAPNFTLGDVAYGHMESQAQAPAGGLDCPVPVTKTFLNASGQPVSSIAAGNTFSWQITFPSIDISKELGCTLTNIKVTDVAKVTSGSPQAIITSASNGGAIGSNQVGPGSGQQASITWSLPDYKPGDPPVLLTIGGSLPHQSGSGVILNTANVTATLGSCTGGAAGQAFVSNASVGGRAATVNGTAVTGVGAVNEQIGPATAAAVQAGNLPTTGQSRPWLPVAGGGLLLAALGLLRARRRHAPIET